MSTFRPDITADALALQERDEFRSAGWLKVIAPAKVNLILAVGQRRADGYHDAETVMHALALHDVVYLRRKTPDDADFGTGLPSVQLVGCGDVAVPELPSEDNLAAKAVLELADQLVVAGRLPEADRTAFCDVKMRIEKNIPFQGGLGGASTDAAAALLGAAQLWGIPTGGAPRLAGVSESDPILERAACKLGADVAFFLYGGCAYFEGVGDIFAHALQPSKQVIALIKPDCGVATAAAYRAFDENPIPVDPAVLETARMAQCAEAVPLFNNLAPAAESLVPELADVHSWAAAQPGVSAVLLCGSGATTFAACDTMDAALGVVALARRRGMWARATSLSSVRALVVSGVDVQ